MDTIIVTRHPATISWLAKHLIPAEHPAVYEDGHLVWREVGTEVLGGEDAPAYRRIPVVASATAGIVRGKRVVGNLPLHLAAEAAVVSAVEFDGPPPRGAEYTEADMEAAEAHLCEYVVQAAGRPVATVLSHIQAATVRQVISVAEGAGVPFRNTPDGGWAEVSALKKIIG